MPVSSTLPPVEVPQQDIWAFLFERKDREYPDDKVIYRDADTGRSYTYAQTKTAAHEFGKGLKAVWEWRKGDVLALYSPNCVDTPAITWGTLWAGGIVSPANPAYRVDELAFQLKDSGAKALITQLPFLENARKACAIAGIPDDMIALIGDAREPNGRTKHFGSVRNISGATRYRRTKIKPNEDLAFLVYSSGTTGKPKGVMLTHSNIVANILQLHASESGHLDWKGQHNNEGDKILAFLPFFHIYGLTCLIMQSLHRGFQLVVMPKFEIEYFCQIIEKHKITFVYLVPPVLLLLTKHPVIAKYDLSSLRMVNCGAAPLTHELVHAVYKRLQLPVKQGYGLSETSPTTHVQPWESWKDTIGSVGKLLPNLQAKYIGADGAELPVGQVGELCVKGPNVFKGYLNQPEMTKQAFTEDGFFKTGDIGYEDKNSFFYITDRVKELIKYKGFQVAPAELEGLLLDHPKVNDAAVIGLHSNEQHTELPRAYIVLAAGVEKSDKTKAEINEFVNSKVASHKRLRGGIFFIDEVPKGSSGKILRRVLKDQALKEEELKAKL
ncbi:4-coumarate-CoA ligase-like protein [Trichodelitschia bisporula]|uniref:4-coumarate-CoA ligase-like protein n=1 Tax=Trichodelitschia bisporula TaxID=703511 RepID=A0A6G1IB51_9PEZI|nr:4-coumarate-CoA ligase-like protein [Trichodelitschia bisporula]